MKYILFFSLLLFCSANALAQAKLITFNSEGKAISAETGATVMPVDAGRKIQKGPAFKLNTANSAPVKDFQLDPKEKSKLRKEIAEKFEKALDNLQDEKLNLKDIYDSIWGTGETDKIIKEYQAFLNYLNDETGTAASHDQAFSGVYLPKPSVFENRVFNASIYTEVDDNSGKEYDMRKLVFTNPYRHFILSYLQETMSENSSRIDLEKMNNEYKKGWRDLEDIYAEAQKALKQIKDTMKPCVPTNCLDYKKLSDKLSAITGNGSSNYVMKLLKKSFFKKWLWYNDGFLFMNPLTASSKGRRYPSGETISLLTDSNKRFMLSDSTEAKMFDSILTTRNVKNELLIAQEAVTDKKRAVDRYYYDAAQNYKSLNKKALPKAKDNTKGIAVVAYNVPAKEKLTFSMEKSKETQDMGMVAQSIIDAGTTGTLSSILGNAASWVTAWKKVSTDFNVSGQTPHYTNMTGSNFSTASAAAKVKVPFGADYQKVPLSNYNALQSFAYKDFESRKKNFSSDYSSGITPEEWKILSEKEEIKFSVVINNRLVLATKNSDADKIIFIKAYLIEPDIAKCNSCIHLVENCLIDTFILRDRCYALNYESQQKLADGTKLLLTRFACYIKEIDDCREKLAKKFEEISGYSKILKAYLSIVQRSLPPVLTKKTSSDIFYKEESISKDSAEYRTEIFERTKDDLPDPPKKIVYEVTSSLPGKMVDGKQVTPNVVIQHSYRYSKRHWIDFSAGLAFTPTDYTIKSADGGLPKVSEGDKFRPIAGMHIYPFGGLLKVDDRIRPQLSRLSVYFGLGLTKALENFYPGISYDIVPGMRTVVGYHIYKDTRYTILNNQVIDQASSYRGSGIFVSISMEPKAFATFIGLIK